MSSAASDPGTSFAHALGQANTAPRASAPTATADQFGSARAPGIAASAGMVPPPSGSWPNRRATWSEMITAPMPLMKPDTTGYGTSLMYWPRPASPIAICNRPPSTTAAKTCAGSPFRAVKIPANTTTMGPVGPETSVGAPPSTAATKPRMVAPHKPAIGPAPEASPNARASGRATTPVVRPASTSARRCEDSTSGARRLDW